MIQVPLGHANSGHELPTLHLHLKRFLQQPSCFNAVLNARAQTKNSLYERGVREGLGCRPGCRLQLYNRLTTTLPQRQGAKTKWILNLQVIELQRLVLQ
jgi:hypothetical protein